MAIGITFKEAGNLRIVDIADEIPWVRTRIGMRINIPSDRELGIGHYTITNDCIH